jgi:hypothetical protein
MPRGGRDRVLRGTAELVDITSHPERYSQEEHAEALRDLADMKARVAEAPSRAKAARVAAQKERDDAKWEAQGVEVDEGTPLSKLRGKKVWLYHGTTSKLVPSIQRDGLRPSDDHGKRSNIGSSAFRHATGDSVFLSARSSGDASAHFYAQQAARRHGGDPVVLRVLVDGDDLQHDPDDKDIQSGRYQYVVPRVEPHEVMEVNGERRTVKKSFTFGLPAELLSKSLPVKERRTVHGLGIAIENPKGSVRKWRDPKTGESGETTIVTPYGYVEDTKGADGEEVDVFVGPHPESDKVFVINQRRVDDYRRFDEHKVVLGARTIDEARSIYLRNYDKKGPKMLGSIRVWSVERFKRWLEKRGKKNEPVRKALS